MKTIGLLGGMSWESSAHYYAILNRAIRDRLGHPHSARSVMLSVDFGEATPRQVVSGIAKFVAPESLVGQQRPFVTNLKPRPIMGLESQAMILAAKSGDGLALLSPTSPVTPGTKLG